MQQLAQLLLANHGINASGCLETKYEKIPGLELQASSTNGTSGIGCIGGKKLYWHLNSGLKWNGQTLIKISEPFFEVEFA